jgi:hypothetical protein
VCDGKKCHEPTNAVQQAAITDLSETYVANIDCDHLAPRVGAALGRKMDTISYDVVRDNLRRGESSSNIYIVIILAKSQILAEEEILHEAVCLNRAWKVSPQDTPHFTAFLPRLGFPNTNALHPKDEGGREISPQSFAVEVGTMQRIPRRTHLMTGKRPSAPSVRLPFYRRVFQSQSDPE